MKTREVKYWIVVASKDHVRSGVAGGFTQACHGKVSPLKRMQKDDVVICYSGKQTLGGSVKCQEFTAIGQVKDEGVYEFRVSEDFCPSRRNIDFFESKDVSILPLINDLEFIRNKKNWGMPFRFGFLEIPENDFKLISSNMLKEDHAEQH